MGDKVKRVIRFPANSRELEGRFYFGVGWRTLRDVLENRFMSTIYVWIFLLPILINISIDLPSNVLLQPFFSEPKLRLNLELPFSLYFLYYSALSLSVARFSYSWYCPRFLRQYSSPAKALADGITSQQVLSEILEFVPSYFSDLPPYFSKQGVELRRTLDQIRAEFKEINELWQYGEFRDSSGMALHEAIARVKLKESGTRPGYYELKSVRGEELFETTVLIEREQFLKTISWDLIRLQDTTYPKARMMIFGFSALGVLLFVIPLAQNMIMVTQYFVEKLGN